MKSTWIDMFTLLSSLTHLVVYLQLKLFMHQLFLKLHMFTGNNSVNTNISCGSRVNFLRV